MTLKQGEEINNKFSTLNDSITKLNVNVSRLNEELVFAKVKKIEADVTLKTTADSLVVSEDRIKELNNLIKKNESYYWKEKRTWAGWMFFSVVVTVLVGALK